MKETCISPTSGLRAALACRSGSSARGKPSRTDDGVHSPLASTASLDPHPDSGGAIEGPASTLARIKARAWHQVAVPDREESPWRRCCRREPRREAVSPGPRRVHMNRSGHRRGQPCTPHRLHATLHARTNVSTSNNAMATKGDIMTGYNVRHATSTHFALFCGLPWEFPTLFFRSGARKGHRPCTLLPKTIEHNRRVHAALLSFTFFPTENYRHATSTHFAFICGLPWEFPTLVDSMGRGPTSFR